MKEATVKGWFAQLEQAKISPNAEQMALLHAIKDRCKEESREFSFAKPPASASSPKRYTVLAFRVSVDHHT